MTPPDVKAKRAIIESKLKGIELSGITTEDILEMTEKNCIAEVDGTFVRGYYYSAADICGIIEEACRLALERIQEAQSRTPIPLTRDMFERSFKKLKPSISASLLMEYDNF